MKKKKNLENFDMIYELLQPWSTFVMATSLPPPVLEKMIKITDEILENKKPTEKAGKTLVGQIEDEFFIAPKILKREGLIPFFLDICKNYIIHASLQSRPFDKEEILKEKWLPKLTMMWIVAQKDHEYNPIHVHNGHISAIMYLKIPEYLPSSKSHKPDDDGSITFTNNSSTDRIWGTPNLQVQPQVGTFLIFPSAQMHLVYPFRTPDGKGERRSVSFNASYTSKSTQDFLKKKNK